MAHTYIFGHDECVLHQVDPGSGSADNVERVGGLQELVLGVVHDGGRKGVETDKVRYCSIPL